ncbi:hypothetical protein LSAT2_021756 [Lamellibrachia satsuma]|nr:hypothetical protein LSAT2_021756 [Lamellibrachia satsuma]
MAFCYGCWTELSNAGIPEISPETIANIILNLLLHVTRGIPVAPGIATWLFVISCLNIAYPHAYKSVPLAAWKYVEEGLQVLGVYVVFRTLWGGSMDLLRTAVKSYSPLPYVIWLWLSLIVVVLSVVAVIASAHYTNAFWQSEDEPKPTASAEPDGDTQPLNRQLQRRPTSHCRRPDLNYPEPGSFNRALAYIPVTSKSSRVLCGDIPEPSLEPPANPVGWLARLFGFWEGPLKSPSPAPPPWDDDHIDQLTASRRVQWNSRA